ncbi:hypothetical protein [Stutzerimonas stutzeri]|jgi:hypothetical protein|uniref:Nutrient deprivation-induced protein n=1 Tax=Stutzerimonas stutzeri TaxID=316 RepID=A0A0D9AUE3_STUST|nr:hypothetical protein [Stutzerimonas stutzeri]KJH83001.1 hypothetical protein UF78_06410 [Stutzerimonas stutzeri]
MTTPDEEITGYGGLSKTGPDTASATSNSTNGQSTSSASTGHVAEDAKAKARQAADQVKTQGKSQLEGYRETAADELEKVAQSAKAAAEELEGQDRLGLSNYVSSMAQSMVKLSDDLRGKSVDELFQDVNQLARNNPGLFIAGSVALGFGLTRFARASSKRAAQGDYGHRDSSTSFSSGSQYGSSRDGYRSDQEELNDRLNTGEPGTIGSVSNAGVSSATSASRSTTSTTGTGVGIGTGAGTGASSNGLGSTSGTGLGSTSSRDGKGTDGGLFP